MAKMTKNLSLDTVAVGRGERYSELHQTNLSRLVSDFLARLPLDDATRQLSPTVSRLLGIAAVRGAGGAREGDRSDEEYEGHLWAKYGRP